MLTKLIKRTLAVVETLLCRRTFYDITSFYGLRINPREKKKVLYDGCDGFHSYNTYFEDMKALNDNGYQVDEILNNNKRGENE